jgi:hypothetical protein
MHRSFDVPCDDVQHYCMPSTESDEDDVPEYIICTLPGGFKVVPLQNIANGNVTEKQYVTEVTLDFWDEDSHSATLKCPTNAYGHCVGDDGM